MPDTLRLFIVVAKTSLITAAIYVAVVALVLRVIGPAPSSYVIVVATLLLPISAGTWWMYRDLQSIYTRYEARKIATAFALFTPVSLAVALLGSELTGGYGEMLASLFPAWIAFILFGVALVGGFVAIITLSNFMVSVFVLWITRTTTRTDY